MTTGWDCQSRRHLPGTLMGLLALLVIVAWTPVQPGQPSVSDITAYPWPYLRDGWPLTPGEPAVEVVIVGDVMLGRGVVWQTDPLAAVMPWLRAADLTLGNLEGVITASAPPPQTEPDLTPPYSLLMPVSAIAALQGAGFDMLNLANNHALDGGAAGLAESVAYLQNAGITPFGLASAGDPTPQPVIRAVRGVRLAFLGFNRVPYGSSPAADSLQPAGWDYAQAVAAIESARAQADAVIVSIHWGYEYEMQSDPDQRAVAQTMVDAGADLVVGHHPHVVQEIKAVTVSGAPGDSVPGGGDSFVAYSLGNFVFDQQFDETRYGLALRAFFDHEGLRAVQVLPVYAGPRPQLMSPSEAAPLLARLELAPSPMPGYQIWDCHATSVTYATVDPTMQDAENMCWSVDVIAPVAATGGVFRSGAIDLTGDGWAEEVQLADGQVVVYAPPERAENRQELWRSPPEWHVVDVALGDPNDDGRGELMLAMWKPDAAGVLQGTLVRSHPFIVGYREGIYRALWGGSAVVRPLREVELGDVNGDGAPELIVLEDEGRDSSRVAVWRWHGWGFSLLWRSSPGRYHDLRLMPGADGQAYIVFTDTPVPTTTINRPPGYSLVTPISLWAPIVPRARLRMG